MPESIMIFTAGKGTRMLPLTLETPKPMIKVNGLHLAEYAFTLAQEEDLNVVMNLHHLPQSIRAFFEPKSVLFSDEQNALLETGGGLRAAKHLLDSDPVYTLNSDTVWRGKNPLSLLKRAWDPAKMDALLMLLPSSHVFGRKGGGDFSINDAGQISRGGPLLYSGAQIIRTHRLHEIESIAFSLNQYWDLLLKDQKVFGMTYPGDWCDVGQIESIAVAESFLDHTPND